MINLNLGSGNDYVKDWVNVDIYGKFDLMHDLKTPLPYKQGEVDAIRCIAVLEHFNKQDGERLLNHMCQLLKIQGTLELKLPMADRIINSSMSVEEKIYYLFGDPNYDGLNLGDAGCHKWGWTNKGIRDILAKNNMLILFERFEDLCEINLHIMGVRT